MNADEVISRILEIKNFKISYSELARIIGIQRQNMTRYKKSDLKEEHIRRIENHFSIILGDEPAFINLPVRGEIVASMGAGLPIGLEFQTNGYQITPQLLKMLGANEKETDIIFSRGNSMMPTIEDGDALMVDKSKREIIDGKIYVIRLDGQLLAKRLQKLPPRNIMVVSDNKELFPPYQVDLSDETIDFEVIGRVLWYSRIAI